MSGEDEDHAEANVTGLSYEPTQEEKDNWHKAQTPLALEWLQRECYSISRDHGWYDRPREDGTTIALIMREASEALEALRTDDNENCEEELADVIIRTLDFAQHKGYDLGAAVLAKMEKNRNRPYRHGNKRF